MTDHAERDPEYDPEAAGFPDTVDPDSSAYDEPESVRAADGPDQILSPYYRPVALDRFGTTPAEAQAGMSLDQRLAREVPDVSTEETPEDRLDDDLPYDPDADYAGGDDAVGRLVAADDDGLGRGSGWLAEDEGMAGGGASAEEAAMHIEDPTGRSQR